MAYKDIDGLSGSPTAHSEMADTGTHLSVEGSHVELPDSSFIRDAAMSRDGVDLILDGPNGTVVVDAYFAQADLPTLSSPDGLSLSPNMVNSFVQSSNKYAGNLSLNDESAVGEVTEFSGEATVTHSDGSVEPITLGTDIYQGDVIETNASGAVNITFTDDTTFAVSNEARLAIDEYVFDPSTQSGTQDFSVLKGIFVFTSGLIGRDDPDDVNIDTPSGSIGIRGTIIAGNVDNGEITVVEGAIVVRDLTGGEMTLATQFETAKMDAIHGLKNLGQLAANDVLERFVSVSGVAPTLFSSINDAAHAVPPAPNSDMKANDAPVGETREDFDANGSVDQNNDSQVDGTINDVDTGTEDTSGDGEGEVLLQPKTEMMQNTPMQNTMMGVDNMGMQPMAMTGMNVGMKSSTMGAPMTTTLNKGTVLIEKPLLNPDGTKSLLPKIINSETALITDTAGNNVIDHLPIHIKSFPAKAAQFSTAPEGYFKTSADQDWLYRFDREFYNNDSNNGDVLTFKLSAATVAALNTWQLSGDINSWSFSTSDGALAIDTNVITSNFSFAIEILATDSAGQNNAGGYKSYNFDAILKDNELNQTEINSANNGDTLADTGSGNDNIIIGGGGNQSNLKVFVGDSLTSDTVTILDGTNNYINLGNGTNNLTISGSANNTGNTIIGSNQANKVDTIQMDNVSNKIYAMAGDDIIKINMINGGANADLTSSVGTLIDGGRDKLNFIDTNAGHGDTLAFDGTSTSIDFRQVDDAFIRGIERLDFTNTSANVTLSLQDIIQMTDIRNTLIIRADADDNLTFAGDFSNFVKVATPVLLDHDYDNNTNTDTSFHEYKSVSDGVSIFIEDTANSVTGLPV